MTNYKRTIVCSIVISFFICSTSFAATPKLKIVDATVSTTTALQADTIVVKVNNETNLVTGTFGGEKINFFKVTGTNNWIGIIGVDVKKKPLKYTLRVNAKGKQQYVRYVTVKKRKFPITELILTPTLITSGYTPTSIVNDTVDTANPIINATLKPVTPTNYINQNFSLPLSSITIVGQYGSIRKNKISSLQHLGVDLRAPLMTEVFAINDGKVVLAKTLPNYGNTMIIDHGYGVYSLYLHLDRFIAVQDQIIKRGDMVGYSGNTGYSTGAHLHFSVKVGKASVDPLKFIDATKNLY